MTLQDEDSELDITYNSGSNGCGCSSIITTIIVIIAVWALVFGVTIDGKHHGLSGCDRDKGVIIDK